MHSLKHLLILTSIALCLSCQNEHKYNYAIKDFRNSLQPFLINIVSKGIVGYHNSSKIKNFTVNELNRLSRCENPVLRATAARELLDRDTFNHFDLLVNHLDDTAIIAINAGEFGIWYRTVSDDILQEASWKTREDKDKTIEQVITQHNYLRSAYTILKLIEPKEKYYPYIKDMATRPRRLSDDDYELDFDDIEYALYGLAKFKKPYDVKIIKEQMIKNGPQLSNISFRLMEEFPDTAYFDVLESYHRRRFYKFSGNRREGFSGFVADKADPEDFIQALVMQQNENSAKLLDTMLNRLPLRACMPDKDNIIKELIMAIWEHPCSSYAKLREKIKPKAKEILKGQISIPMDSLFVPLGTTKKIISWYN